MTILFKKLTCLFLCILFSLTFSAIAQQIAPGGNIYFRGAVVTPTCTVDTQKTIELSCFHNGKMVRSNYGAKQDKETKNRLHLVAGVKMQYAKSNINIAVLNIEYK